MALGMAFILSILSCLAAIGSFICIVRIVRSCPHLSSVRGRGWSLPHYGNRHFAPDTTNATPHEMRGQTIGGVYQRFPGPHDFKRPGAKPLPYCHSCGTAHVWGRHIKGFNPRVRLVESDEEVATNESYKYDHLN
jgi:hypothetical protein